MTFLNERPLDIPTPALPWQGADTGFVENMQAAWNDENLRFAGQGIEANLETQWEENVRTYEALTGGRLLANPVMKRMFMEGAMSLEGRPQELNIQEKGLYAEFQEADRKLQEYKAANPNSGVLSFSDMWGQTKQQNKEFAAKMDSVSRRAGAVGVVGSFVGSIGAALNPRTNPLLVATMPVGGVGRGIMTRVLTEAGAGAAVETVNQFTGVEDRQELLGTPTSDAEKWMQVGFAALGSGVLRGGIELAPSAVKTAGQIGRKVEEKIAPQRAAGRTALENVAQDLAPVMRQTYEQNIMNIDPSHVPGSTNRGIVQAEQAAVSFARSNPFSDDGVGQALHEKRFMDAVEPLVKNLRQHLLAGTHIPELEGTVFTRPNFEASEPVFRSTSDMNKDPAVTEAARSLDTGLINEFERLTALKEERLRWVDDLSGRAKDERIERTLATLDEEIEGLKFRQTSQSAKNRKKSQRKIDRLEADRADIEAQMREADSPDMARVRQEAMDIDEQLRDMAPEVGRVFEKARDKIGKTLPKTKLKIALGNRSAIEGIIDRQILDNDRPFRSAVDLMDPKITNGMTLQDSAVKMMRETDQMDPKVEAINEATVDTVKASVNEEANTIDLGEGLEKVDLDTKIQVGEGENDVMTLRDFLAENDADDEFIQAMTTCGLGGAV